MNDKFFDKTLKAINTQGLKVLEGAVWQGGELKASRVFREAPRPNVWSVSKTFTALAAGFAACEGLLKLTDRLADVFPEYHTDCGISVMDAISLKTGHSRCPVMANEYAGRPENDLLKLFFAEPLTWPRGTHWYYDNSGFYAVARAIERLSGEPLDAYLTPRLFAPLGIATPEWERCPLGHIQGFSGLHLNALEIARVGEALLRGGEGLIPGDFVRLMTSRQTDNSQNDQSFATIDHKSGYGCGLWLCRVPGSYRMDGSDGNYCVMLPDKDAVVCFVSEERPKPDAVLELVWDTVYERL